MQRVADTLLDITTSGTVISAMPEHPFYVPELGWVRADAHQPRLKVLTARGHGIQE